MSPQWRMVRQSAAETSSINPNISSITLATGYIMLRGNVEQGTFRQARRLAHRRFHFKCQIHEHGPRDDRTPGPNPPTNVSAVGAVTLGNLQA